MLKIINKQIIKYISFLLISVYIVFTANLFFAVHAVSSDYKDIKGHWAEKYLVELIDKGYIKGVNSGGEILIQPGRNITRAEFLTILMRTGDYSVNPDKIIRFSDVSDKDWFKENIDKATGNSISGGYPDGTFKPNNPISRAEIASLIARIGKFDANIPPIASSFTDVKKNKWYFTGIMSAKINGIINGYADGSFKPDGKATRAEVAVMIYNYLKLLKKVDGTVSTPPATSMATVLPTATPTGKASSAPTGTPPGSKPYVTPPDDIINPRVDIMPKIYGFDSWSSNETELLYDISYLDLSNLGKFSIKITYDSTKVVASRVFEGSAKASGYITKDGTIDLSRADTGEIIITSNDTSQVISGKGTLFYIKFVVLPGASGKTDINIKGENSDKPELYKTTGEKINPDVISGSITFK